MIQDSFGNQVSVNDISEALTYVDEYKSMLEEYEEYVTLFEKLDIGTVKGIRTWFINMDMYGNKYLDSKY